MRWQKRARLAVAIFGIAFAGVVFFAISERENPVPAPAPERMDPAAVVEASRGLMHRVTGARQDFVVTFERQLAYEGGASKLFGVRIEVKERQGRDFVITGAEAEANEQSREIRLTGDVRLKASDGFELSTAAAAFRESDGIVRTPGSVVFGRGGMSGTGVGMTYDRNADVLTIAERAEVKMVDAAGVTTAAFTAGAATLARQENYLLLERAVHALRGEQTIDADRAVARLTDNEEAITYIELRGGARVAGGSAGFQTIAARDIDLDYTEDGLTLERVALTGAGHVVLKPTAPSAGATAPAARALRGEAITVAFAPDGALTAASARDAVQLDLPAGDGPRRVRAGALDAVGEPGKGMTSARFEGDVEYREETATRTPARVARAGALFIALDGDALGSAVFTERVRFEEGTLRASAAEVRYEPDAGALRLNGSDAGGGPRVADERIAIEGDAIHLTLEGRMMSAAGAVKTVLQGTADAAGLLNARQPTNVSAAALEYDGAAARASYSGSAQLWQGDTAIRADRIALDRQNGNLAATGNARSTLRLGETTSIGRAEAIRYDDASRQITYEGRVPLATAATPGEPGEGGPAADEAVPAQLSGPQGDLTANRIAVLLAPDDNRLDRLEAYGGITLRLDTRVATGARLTYHAADERYVMSGAAAAPVLVIEACRETTGQTLTFFKSTDRIIVDGNEDIRTRTKSGGPCAQPRSR